MNDHNERLKLHLETTIHSISELSNGLTEIIIHSPRLITTIDIGEFIKFQNYYKSNFYLSEPVALTPVYLNYKENLVHFIVHEVGASTKILGNLQKGERVVTMGAVGSKFDLSIFQDKKIIFACEDFLHYLNLFLLTEIFSKKIAKNITFISDNSNKIPEFYRNKIIEHADCVIDCKSDNQKMINQVHDLHKNNDYIISGISNKNTISAIEKLPIKIINLINAPLQCMMNGICSKCVQQNESGEYFFNCGKSRYRLYNSNFDYNHPKMWQNSLVEKINYIKIKKLIEER